MTSRRIVGALVACSFVALASAEVIYEDGFDGTALNPAWTVWGSGSYSVNAGDLEFTTLPGDFVDAYQAQAGAPKHVFLIDVDPSYDTWSAVVRVRFNTPTQIYQQVDVVAVDDAETNVKLSYERGGGVWSHGLVSESGATGDSAFVNVPQKTDYFWLRMDGDRITDTYAGFYSNDTTTNPALVSWIMSGQVTNPRDIGRVGIGGWNALASFGQIAEFDAFYLYGHVRRLGDLNCDGHVTFADIDPFILALSSGTGYDMAYPDCDRTLADCNSDSYIDFGDIDAFVGVLGRAAE